MSKYLVNKFLYTIDRDPDLVERYREDRQAPWPGGRPDKANVILNCPGAERSTWLSFTDAERDDAERPRLRRAVQAGAHNFLLLTLFIALFERDYEEPLAFQREFAARLSHWSVPYPDIAT